MEHLSAFITRHRLTSDDYGVSFYEHEMRTLDHLCCWDQVDVTNIAGVEILMRQAQLVDYTYAMAVQKDKSAPPTNGEGGGNQKKGQGKKQGHGEFLRLGFVDEMAVFSGTSKEDGLMCVCPDLLEHVAREVERDAGILKQIRKAREERRALAS